MPSCDDHVNGTCQTCCMQIGMWRWWYLPTNLPTHQPTNLPTYPPTHLPTYPPTHLPTYPPTHLPTYQPTNLPTYQPTDLSTYQPTYLPTNLPTYLPACLPTCQAPFLSQRCLCVKAWHSLIHLWTSVLMLRFTEVEHKCRWSTVCLIWSSWLVRA